MAKYILQKVKSICHRYTVSICQRCSQSFMREPPRCGAHSKEDTRTDTVFLQLGMKSDPCQRVMLDTKLATNLQGGTAFHFRVIFSSGWKSLPFLLDKTIYIVQFLPSLTDGIWVLIRVKSQEISETDFLDDSVATGSPTWTNMLINSFMEFLTPNITQFLT